MRAELVFVGTELLLGEIVNTNAQYLSRRLAELGVDQYYQVTVGDNAQRLAGVLQQALGRADVVITSGGLGPTDDDLTRDVAAVVAGRPLAEDSAVLASIEDWFRRAGRPMTANNRRQALVPAGATVLPNPVGTAPGLIIPVGEQALILLPGPPAELIRMFEDQVAPYLLTRLGPSPQRLYTRTLRFCGVGESALAGAVQDILAGQTDPTIAPYAKPGEVHLRLATKAASAEEAAARLDPVEEAIRQRAGRYLFGRDDTTLEAAVGQLLRRRGWTLALAESCTGGLVAKRITDVPGASDYFVAGYITYADAAKQALLEVPAAVLAEHGAVSAETVAAMAAGARRLSGATVAVSISGIAGPGGGTPQKPVGTVWVGLATPEGVKSHSFLFRGERDHIRQVSAQYALSYLWNYLKEKETGGGA